MHYLRDHPWLAIAACTACLGAVLLAARRVARWVKRHRPPRGRKRRREPLRGGGGGAGVLGVFQQIVEPEIRHVIEAQRQERAVVKGDWGRGDGDGDAGDAPGK